MYVSFVFSHGKLLVISLAISDSYWFSTFLLDSINCLRYACYIWRFEIWPYFFLQVPRCHTTDMTLHYSCCKLHTSLLYRIRDAVCTSDVFRPFFLFNCQVSKVKFNFALFRVFWDSEIYIIARLTAGWRRNRVSISGRDNIFSCVKPSQAGTETHTTHYWMGTGGSSWELSGLEVMLTIDLYVGPMIRIGGVLPPSPVWIQSVVLN